MLIATPLQFIWELACVYLVKIKHNQDKAGEARKMLTFQIILTIVYLYLLAQLIHDIYEIIYHGRPGLMFTTLLYSLFLDNLKSGMTLSIVYCVVVSSEDLCIWTSMKMSIWTPTKRRSPSRRMLFQN